MLNCNRKIYWPQISRISRCAPGRRMLPQLWRHCKPWRFHGQVFTAPWEEFLGKMKGKHGELKHCEWAVVLSLVCCRQQGAPMLSQWQPQPMQAGLLLTAGWWLHLFLLNFAHFLRPQPFVARSLEFFYTMLGFFSNVSIPPNQNCPIILGRKPL